VQEALIAAAAHWPRDGVPTNPQAWLMTTAERRLIDQRRSEHARANREVLVAQRDVAPTDATQEDDPLTVLFMCCHPALTPASAIALTLRAFGGLTTDQIARAFLVPEATMAQRISRAKRTIKESGVPFQTPDDVEMATRMPTVLRVLYLIFNEGYAASAGTDVHRVDLSDEAIRLTRTTRGQLPDDPEVAGLLALMLLLDARRPARTTVDGDLIPLADQDRSIWDRRLIDEGTGLLDNTLGEGGVGEYRLQAAIAAIHDRANRAADTDWPQIAALYELLEQATSNPVVRLNRAVAVGMADGPAAGLAILDGLDESLAGNHRLAAVRAYLLEMAGDTSAAIEQYRIAARTTPNLPEQRYLTTQIAKLNAALG
jgi:predicted RNA polymerase sigma factor